MNKYRTLFFTNLKKSYESQQDFYPDITLHSIADDSRLPCHRIILATSSEYFKNVFSWSSVDVIEVHNNISGEVLGIILKYIYSGEITLTLENASDILSAANYFNLLEIVKDCTTFLLKNIEMTTCIGMLKLAYQLDLSELIDGTLSFVANNFSNILENCEYKANLCSLPIKLMIELLKSNELVTRNSETGLCTRPVEREKHVIEFILSYCENLSDKSVVSSLLPSIRWPILKIFEEEDYVFKKLTPHLDESKGKKELEDLLDIKFTDWYKSPETSKPTKEDKSLYFTRAYSCSELITLAPMVNHAFFGTSEQFNCIADETQYLRKVNLVSKSFDSFTVIAGIGLTFSSNGEDVYKHVGLPSEKGIGNEMFDLEKDEHIIEVHGSAGWISDNFAFKTSKNRTYGPYGSEKEGLDSEMMKVLTDYRKEGRYTENCKLFSSIVPGPHKRVSLDTVLAGMMGKVVKTDGDFAITQLSFIFRAMLPSSNFLISSEKLFEVIPSDSQIPFTNGTPEDSEDPEESFEESGGSFEDLEESFEETFEESFEDSFEDHDLDYGPNLEFGIQPYMYEPVVEDAFDAIEESKISDSIEEFEVSEAI